MNRPPIERYSGGDGVSSRRDRVASDEINVFRRNVVESDPVIGVALSCEDDASLRLAQPRRRFNKGIQHRLQIEGRPADDFEHFGSGGLLLERLVQLPSLTLQSRLQFSNGRIAAAHGLWRIAALRLCRLATSRFG